MGKQRLARLALREAANAHTAAHLERRQAELHTERAEQATKAAQVQLARAAQAELAADQLRWDLDDFMEDMRAEIRKREVQLAFEKGRSFRSAWEEQRIQSMLITGRINETEAFKLRRRAAAEREADYGR